MRSYKLQSKTVTEKQWSLAPCRILDGLSREIEEKEKCELYRHNSCARETI